MADDKKIDPYIAQPQGNRKYITGRGPFHVSQELILLRENKITHLVSRNSGSIETYAKVEAARLLGIEIIMIDRNESIPGKSSQIDALLKDILSYLGRNR
jgi:precorrin-6A/cobalt-precorrin-6A reductase